MSEPEYIEFRFFLIGEPGIGKESFISRFDKISSTQTIYPNIGQEKNLKSNLYRNELIHSNSFDTLQDSKFKKNYTSSYKPPISPKNLSSILENPSIYFKDRVIIYDKKEHPSKLFNIEKFKLNFRCFYIFPCEEYDSEQSPRNNYDDEEEDNEFENEYKVTFKKIESKINDILMNKNISIDPDNLPNYRIIIQNLFIFMFDLSDFSSFKKLTIYHKALKKKYTFNHFNFNEENEGLNNINSVVIGNKLDKKVQFDNNQQKQFNDFLNDEKMNYYQISTKPFFHFENFFEELFFELYGLYREEFRTKYFQDQFNLIITSKPTFPKEERNFLNKINEKIPGPGEYNTSIYNCYSIRDIKDAFVNKKTRFNKKIFVNKNGPIFHKTKALGVYDFLQNKIKTSKNRLKSQPKFSFFGDITKDINDKNNIGISFGGGSGPNKLNLIEQRREKRLQNSSDLIENFENVNNYSELIKCSSTFNAEKNKSKIHDDEYFKQANERKNEISKNLIDEKNKRLNKLIKIHNDNLKKREQIKLLKDNSIMSKTNIEIDNLKDFNTEIINQTSTKNKFALDSKELFEKKRLGRYYNSIFANNKKHLKNFQIKREEIINKSDISGSPGPAAYNVRGNLLDKNKGFSMLERREVHDSSFNNNANYALIKDDFEKIIEKNKKKKQITYTKRKEPKESEVNTKSVYANIWNNWELNKEDPNINKRKMNFMNFIEKRKERKKTQEENIKGFAENQMGLEQYRKLLLEKKGYTDSDSVEKINFSLVEDSAPKVRNNIYYYYSNIVYNARQT